MQTVLAKFPHVAGIPGEDRDPLHGLSPRVDGMRRLVSFRRGEEINGENEPSEFWYCVISGAARKYALLSDGRRRIVDFLMPGDFFGFRARHFFATDAILPGTTVARYPRANVETEADGNPQLGRRIREIAFASMWRSQARLLILGRVTSIEKVRAFLVEMTQRSFDRKEQAIVLPMSRYDIADYLALSVETVSRALTELKRRGDIRFPTTRRVRVLDHAPRKHSIEDGSRLSLRPAL